MSAQTPQDKSLERLLQEALARASREPVAGGCPDAEVLAAYVDGGLAPPEQARFETHAALCDDCRAALVLQGRATVGVAATRPSKASRWLRWRVWTPALATAAISLTVAIRFWPEAQTFDPNGHQMARIRSPEAQAPAVLALEGLAQKDADAEPSDRRADAFDESDDARRATIAGKRAEAPARSASQLAGASANRPALKAPEGSPMPKRALAKSKATTEAAPRAPEPVAPTSRQPAKKEAAAKPQARAEVFRPWGGSGRNANTPAARGNAAAEPEGHSELAARARREATTPAEAPAPAKEDLGRTLESAIVADSSHFGAEADMPSAPALESLDALREAESSPHTLHFAGAAWRYGAGGRIEKTALGGDEWVAVATPTEAELLAGVADSPRSAWIVGRRGTVLRWADAGGWKLLPSGTTQDLVAIRSTAGRWYATAVDGVEIDLQALADGAQPTR